MTKPKKSNTILVIEDENLLRQAIVKKLQIKKMEVVSASTGKQALDYLKNLLQKPSVIWLDYFLPDTNGLDLIKKIKKNKKWAKIPIIVVSNSASDEKVHNMLALGAQKYLLKADYSLENIINIIQEFINQDKKNE